MTETLIILSGGACLVLGFIGCVVPVLPGPLLAYLALLVPLAFGLCPPVWQLTAGAVVVVVATVVDYVLPTVFAKKFHCSGWGVFGCLVGTIVGLFFLPLGLVLGPFIGTVAGELIAGKDVAASLRGGIGTLFGFVVCLIVKFAAVAAIGVWFFQFCLSK